MGHGQLRHQQVSPSLIGLKLLRGHGFYAPGHCDLDLWPQNQKEYLWVMAIHDTKKGLPR